MPGATQQARTTKPLAGRNAACPCGSGRKFKQCCLNNAPKRSISPTALLTEVQRCFTRNDFAQAASLLHQLLALAPENAEALHTLGLVAHAQGDVRGALSLLERSVQLAPNNAQFLINFAALLQGAGEHERAVTIARQATVTAPTLPESHLQLGTVLAQQGKFQGASVALREALRLRPDFSEATNTLGVCLAGMGKHAAAIVCYLRTLAVQPNFVPAMSNLGGALLTLERHAEAVDVLDRAVALDPAHADAHVNLGAALRGLGDYERSIATSLRALELRPHEPEAKLNLGNACKERGEFARAIEMYREVISLRRSDPRAYTNLADALRDFGRPDEAAKAYEQALEVRPGFAVAYSNLLYLHAFAHDLPPEAELQLARGWERAVLTDGERAGAAAQRTNFPQLPREGRKLRLGIVSAELGPHAVAEFLQPLLEGIDRERFHVTLFPTAVRSCARAAHLRTLADEYVPVAGVPDADAVQIIRRHNIDVLMDTSGHTATNRLGIFARRAAPVQCTYIGYWATTGLTEMDWFISDPDAPRSVEAGFSEGLWRLPRIAVSYVGDPSLACDQWRPDPSGTVWLGSFNKYAKIREETLALWAKVLLAVPEARLLLEDRGTHEADSHKRICGALSQHGVSTDRVEFIPYVPGHERHMLLYNRLDIALDTLPFNSGTTAFDALWMGVPLVALDGDWIGGRMGASVLRTLGRPEWIANTHEEYVDIVRTLARDVPLRTRLRATQRQEMQSTELVDASRLACALEASFEGMYDRWLTHPS